MAAFETVVFMAVAVPAAAALAGLLTTGYRRVWVEPAAALHGGVDDSQQTSDWLAALREPAHLPAPYTESDSDGHDAEVRRVAQAIDAAVVAFRARLGQAVGDQWAALIAQAERETAGQQGS